MNISIILLLIVLIIYCVKEGFCQKTENNSKKKRRCKKGYGANAPILIVISFDGFESKYINSSYKTLHRIFKEGVRSDFVSLKFANALNVHHTIATGYYPNYHGVFAHEWKDKNNYNVMYNRSQYENELTSKYNIIPIWTLNELNGGTSACMMWPGCEFRYGPEKELPIFHHTYNHTEAYIDRLTKIIEWMNVSITLNPPNLVMVYFNQPDHTAHRYGPKSSNVGERIEELEKFVEKLLEKLDLLKLLKRVDLVFVSDHRVTEIFYKDILDIEAQGICDDVGLFGSDVWLQQQYYTRTSGNNSICNGEYCAWPERCCYRYTNPDEELVWLSDGLIENSKNKYYTDPWNGCTLTPCYDSTPGSKYYKVDHKQYNLSKCLKAMYEENRPPHYKICPTDHYKYNEIPDQLIANYTILQVHDLTFKFQIDSPITLKYKAFGTNLFPKIANWSKEFPYEVEECTPFGVHGYLTQDLGFFLAIGPSFIKNTTVRSRTFEVPDLYSLFTKVLQIEGNFNHHEQFLVIFVCAGIHCVAFYIAANIYLYKKWKNYRKLIEKKRKVKNIKKERKGKEKD